MIDTIGGAEGDRTPDLMNAIHALSQLSYGPFRVFGQVAWPDIRACHDRRDLVLIQLSRVVGSVLISAPLCKHLVINGVIKSIIRNYSGVSSFDLVRRTQ